MQGSQQRQYRRSSQSGRDPARPGKVIASAEPERQTNAARAGASGRKESRAVSPGDSTHRFCWRAPCVRYGRVPFIPLKAGSTPVTEGEARQHSFTRAGRTPGTNLSAWRCLRTNSPNHYHTRPARRVWHVAGGIPAALSISPPATASGKTRGCTRDLATGGDQFDGVRQADGLSRMDEGSLPGPAMDARPAVKPFRPACAEADSPNRNNPC